MAHDVNYTNASNRLQMIRRHDGNDIDVLEDSLRFSKLTLLPYNVLINASEHAQHVLVAIKIVAQNID
jgi:hypothetical protein